MRLVVIARPVAHHSAYSGYVQAVRRVRIAAEYVSPWKPRWLSAERADELVERADRAWYARSSLEYELAAARRMLLQPRTLCHVIYAENDYHYLAAVAPVLHRLGGRVIATFHQPPPEFEKVVGRANAARILPRLDAAVVKTTEQAAHLSQWMEPARIHRLLHGVDTGFFSPEWGERRGDARRPFTVICVGSWLRDYKLLEQVAAELGRRGSEVRFVVVSSAEVAARLGALANVDAHTSVSDERLLSLYREADAFFLPLREATANNSLLEAMACGLPVVATDLPGVREHLGPAEARLVTRSQPGDAVEAIEALAAEPDATRAALGRGSRARAEQLDLDAAAAALHAVYAKAAAARPGAWRTALDQ